MLESIENQIHVEVRLDPTNKLIFPADDDLEHLGKIGRRINPDPGRTPKGTLVLRSGRQKAHFFFYVDAATGKGVPLDEAHPEHGTEEHRLEEEAYIMLSLLLGPQPFTASIVKKGHDILRTVVTYH